MTLEYGGGACEDRPIWGCHAWNLKSAESVNVEWDVRQSFCPKAGPEFCSHELMKGFGNKWNPCFKGNMSKLIRQLETFLMKSPVLGQGVYLAAGAVVAGDVTLGDGSSVWHNAVLRGDINRIVVGHHSNVQDNAVLHLADDYPCLVGDFVTIGHSAVVHACTIGDECLIGMGAIILDGAEIGPQSLIGAGSLVTGGMKVPSGSLVLGSPARVVRSLSQEERQALKQWAEKYVANAAFRRERGL